MFYKLVDNSAGPIRFCTLPRGPGAFAYAELDFHWPVGRNRAALEPSRTVKHNKTPLADKTSGVQLKVSIQLYVIQAVP